jgi:hypothetical protein
VHVQSSEALFEGGGSVKTTQPMGSF